ncbi:uncharacterized protein LOC108678454 [Hyalella azteca]|uniref:Uncharacterized protein LOC108678454 n=1 Tax=Hyalella azteca TaxID=294128 RepID=A0A8B7P876_HYAAZ|nr:uncharacterized protein LOC108678454 [Hyalella azteca]
MMLVPASSAARGMVSPWTSLMWFFGPPVWRWHVRRRLKVVVVKPSRTKKQIELELLCDSLLKLKNDRKINVNPNLKDQLRAEATKQRGSSTSKTSEKKKASRSKKVNAHIGGAVSAVGEETLVTLLEALRVNMRTPPVGCVTLDPLVLEDQVIQHSHSALTTTINLDTMTITGLSEYTIDEVKMNVGELTAFLQLSYKELKLGGQHALKARIARVIPITRRGGFTVTTEHPQVRIKVRLRVVKGRLEVRNVSTSLEISGLKTKLTNLPASGILARILNEVLGDLLREELPRLEVEIDGALRSLLNTEFSNYNVGMSLQILRTSDKLMRRGSIAKFVN